MKTVIVILQTLLLTLSLIVVAAGSVQADDDHNRARELRESGEILPLETILAQVLANNMGRVLEVELKHKHGRYVYELEIVDAQGMVWELVFDAHTGRQLKREREDD